MATPEGIGFLEAVVIDVSDLDRGVAFWAAMLGCEFGPSFEPTFRRATSASGLALVLQKAGEAKTGKNRVHLDIEVLDLDTALRQVQECGGSFVTRVDNQPGAHVVCADPDGNEFCLTLA